MKRLRIRVGVGGAIVGLMGVGLCWRLLGQVPDPGLAIAVTATNQLQLLVTNGVSYANYEIYRRTLIDPAYPWTLHLIGTQGQTNFTANQGIESIGFFRRPKGWIGTRMGWITGSTEIPAAPTWAC